MHATYSDALGHPETLSCSACKNFLKGHFLKLLGMNWYVVCGDKQGQ